MHKVLRQIFNRLFNFIKTKETKFEKKYYTCNRSWRGCDAYSKSDINPLHTDCHRYVMSLIGMLLPPVLVRGTGHNLCP